MDLMLNRKQLEDKILACWVGKNIGGTMGTPYEGKQEMQDIQGYASEKGEPLPNDDLDLQLVWLRAMEDVGPKALSAEILGEYWMTYVTPHWNEYGIGKNNLRMGLQPPLSGEFCNDNWKHSNGAWIRSEVWACLAPGFPNIAIKYAIMDASVDHGIGEGTYAEIFTAALESIAFTETDIRKVVERALTYIPETCQVAKCVQCVLEEYDKKTPYRKVREMLVKMTEELGWFQAPANIAYTVIGLIYGEGDFKKSLIYAINCGDDTDCTGATCGAVLGIFGGMSIIPKDWQEYIGDRIITICINASYRWIAPKTCTELTKKVMRMIPSVLQAHSVYTEYTEGESDYNQAEAFKVLEGYSREYMERSRFSFDRTNLCSLSAVVSYEKEPKIKAGEEFPIKITFKNHLHEGFHIDLNLFLPDGWQGDYNRTVYIAAPTGKSSNQVEYSFTITAGETVSAKNTMILYASSDMRSLPLCIPITLLG